MEVETVVVVAGGHPSPGAVPDAAGAARYVIAADAGVDRGARARAPHRSRDRRLRLGLGRPGSRRPKRRAPIVERTRPPRTRPTSSSRSTPRSRSSRRASSSIGSAGGRLDHLLGSILLLADARYAAATVDAYLDGNRIAVIRGSRTLTGTPGEIVSLLARARPGRGRLDEWARVPAARRDPPGRARAAASRTSSPRRRPRSPSRAAA